jgi:hypothetical protein
MAAPFSSYGYEGSVNELGHSLLHRRAGGIYSVYAPTDWAVSIVGTGTRRTQVAAGIGSGKGIVDATDAAVILEHDEVSSGTRYDLIVARRNWETNETSFVVIKGSSLRTVPSRSIGTGVLDDHPIALVRLVAGQTLVQEVIDLRVWIGSGGAVAKDELVTQFLTDPGTQVRIGGSLLQRVINPTNGLDEWTRVALHSPINMYAVGGVLDGSFQSSAPPFYIQAGTSILTTDGAGFARINFPLPFPNVLVSILMTNGDDAAGQDLSFNVAGTGPGSNHGTGNRSSVVYRVWGPTNNAEWTKRWILPNFRHRVNWIAVGG